MTTETESRASLWGIILVQGIAVIILSLLLLAKPWGTTFLIALFFGVFLLFYSVIELYHALFSSKNVDNRLWMSVKGFLALIGGVLILLSPLFFTAVIPGFILYSVALILIFVGAIALLGKPQGEDHRHIATMILGALEILLGIILLITPTRYGLTMLLFSSGLVGIFMGITMIFDAFRLRKLA